MPKMVEVREDWLAEVLDAGHGCPFCGSQRAPHVRPASYCGPNSHFTAQRGCLDCNRWWDPVRLVDGPCPTAS
jgi:hypothetical protein